MRNLDEIIYDIRRLVEVTYEQGYLDGLNQVNESNKCYTILDVEKARNEAWECARKIACIRTDAEWKEFFEFLDVKLFHPEDIFTRYTASEAMQKIKDYERKQKWAEQAKRGKEHRDEIEKMLEGKLAKQCDNCEYKGLGGCTRQAKGYSDLCIDFSKYKPKNDAAFIKCPNCKHRNNNCKFGAPECHFEEELQIVGDDFLEFLMNHMNPNEMEKYIGMYNSKNDKVE